MYLVEWELIEFLIRGSCSCCPEWLQVDVALVGPVPGYNRISNPIARREIDLVYNETLTGFEAYLHFTLQLER